jgi:acyl-CoA thioesterase
MDRHEAQDPFGADVGVAIWEETPGVVVATLEVTPRHLNQHGTVHGGALFTLADVAFARASNARGAVAVALDTAMTFVRPARVGTRLVARCEEEVLRRRIGVYAVRITDETGETVALFRGTVFRRPEGAA